MTSETEPYTTGKWCVNCEAFEDDMYENEVVDGCCTGCGCLEKHHVKSMVVPDNREEVTA